jgi:hypothetical protein
MDCYVVGKEKWEWRCPHCWGRDPREELNARGPLFGLPAGYATPTGAQPTGPVTVGGPRPPLPGEKSTT